MNGEGHSTKEFTCPFHGWNYKCGQGLTELKTTVALGMVWVILDQQSDFDLKNSFDVFSEDWAQVMYFIFPCSFFLFYKEHVALLTMIPLSIDKTEFRYIPLVGKTIDLENQKIKAAADFLKVILKQDFDILEGIQKNLNAEALENFTFMRSEHVLADFHRKLNPLV